MIRKLVPIKLIYMESIRNPDKLLHHASSLIRKGCRIAGIKAGTTESSSRAASSHTGAMASIRFSIEALFRNRIVSMFQGREELTTVASVFFHKKLKGKSIFASYYTMRGPARNAYRSLSAWYEYSKDYRHSIMINCLQWWPGSIGS